MIAATVVEIIEARLGLLVLLSFVAAVAIAFALGNARRWMTAWLVMVVLAVIGFSAYLATTPYAGNVRGWLEMHGFGS